MCLVFRNLFHADACICVCVAILQAINNHKCETKPIYTTPAIDGADGRRFNEEDVANCCQRTLKSIRWLHDSKWCLTIFHYRFCNSFWHYMTPFVYEHGNMATCIPN